MSKAAGSSQNVAWHTGSAFGDFDADGNLDLYITGYVDIHSLSFNEPAPVCQYLGLPVFCGPIGLKGERGALYHNNGDGTFSDVTKRAGVGDVNPTHGFSAVFDDFNDDGKIDIFVANDSDPNLLFLKQGNGSFKESGLERGVAFNADGRAQSNMGVAIGDYANTGKLDILTTTFYQDSFPLFKQEKPGFFEDVSSSVRLATITMPYLGWACGITDFDNDGARELWTANGHVYPEHTHYRQPFTVFRNHGGTFSLTYSSRPLRITPTGVAALAISIMMAKSTSSCCQSQARLSSLRTGQRARTPGSDFGSEVPGATAMQLAPAFV